MLHIKATFGGLGPLSLKLSRAKIIDGDRLNHLLLALSIQLIFVLFPTTPCHSRGVLIAMNDEVRGMCQQAEQLINSGEFDDAITLLNRAGSKDQGSGEVHGYLGMAYQNSGRTAQAIPEYIKALSLNPQMSFINVNLGTCYMNSNQLDKAVPYFQRYLQDNPNAADSAQVRSYIAQAGSRAAAESLKSLVQQGQALLNQKRYADACSAFQQAIAMQPSFAPAHFFLGYAFSQSGQHQQAIGEFQTTLKLDPTVKEAVIDTASNYQSLGDCARAISWYERYLGENPGSAKANDVRQRISGLRQQLANEQKQGAAPSSSNQDDYLSNAASGGRFFRWTRMPIRVCIASGGNVSAYRDAFSQILIRAFSQWAQASQNRVSFTQVGDPAQADILCYWTGDQNAVIEGGRPVEGGLTKLNAQPGPNNNDASISGVKMVLLTNRGGNPLTDEEMYRVCLHEVGHAIGISGHSNNNHDIMFFSEIPSASPSLSERDRLTVTRLYGNVSEVDSAQNQIVLPPMQAGR